MRAAPRRTLRGRVSGNWINGGTANESSFQVTLDYRMGTELNAGYLSIKFACRLSEEMCESGIPVLSRDIVVPGPQRKDPASWMRQRDNGEKVRTTR